MGINVDTGTGGRAEDRASPKDVMLVTTMLPGVGRYAARETGNMAGTPPGGPPVYPATDPRHERRAASPRSCVPGWTAVPVVSRRLAAVPGRGAPALGLAAGVAAGVALAGGLSAGAYASPSVVRVLPVRLHLTRRLAGIGNPSHVALTFDDGPDPSSTPAVLETLDRLGWTATFFFLGSMTAAATGLAAEVAAAGHEIAVHGYTHEGAIRRSPAALSSDVVRARDLIAGATGVAPRWYRPPYGELSVGSLVAARAAGLRLILWSAWGRDWRADATPASVMADLDRGVLAGGTILLHDSDCTSAPGSWRTTVAALPLLAERLAALGLAPGPLRDHGLDKDTGAA